MSFNIQFLHVVTFLQLILFHSSFHHFNKFNSRQDNFSLCLFILHMELFSEFSILVLRTCFKSCFLQSHVDYTGIVGKGVSVSK